MSEGAKRLQITLRSLLLSTSFIGAGIGCYMAALGLMFTEPRDYTDWLGIVNALMPGLQFLAAGPLIGAGIFTPFARARLGAYIGFFVPIIVVFGYVVFLVGWKVVSAEPVAWQVAALTAFAFAVTTCGVFYRIWQRRKRQSISENPISD